MKTGRAATTCKEAELLTFGVNPGVGYRVSDWLSVGAGFSILYAELLQKAAINNAAVPGQAGLGDGQLKIESDDVGYGFNLGVLLEPVAGTRFGITYRSEVKLGFKDVASASNVGPVLQGALNLSGLAGSKVNIDMTVPQAVMLSGCHQINERWAIMGNIGWQDWSAFGKQEIGLDSTTSRSFTKDLNATTPGISPWVPNAVSPRTGSGPFVRPTIPHRWTTTRTARRTWPWTVKSASPQGFSTTGARM